MARKTKIVVNDYYKNENEEEREKSFKELWISYINEKEKEKLNIA